MPVARERLRVVAPAVIEPAAAAVLRLLRGSPPAPDEPEPAGPEHLLEEPVGTTALMAEEEFHAKKHRPHHHQQQRQHQIH